MDELDVRLEIPIAMQKDIQDLIPETYKDLVEAVPKGLYKGAAQGALLLGGLLGAVACMLVANWMIPGVFAVLLVAQRIWVWKSDRGFDRRIGELEERGLTWKDGDKS